MDVTRSVTQWKVVESCLWQRCVGIQKVDKTNLPQGQPKQSLKQLFKKGSVFLKSSVNYQNGSGTKYGHTTSELLERVHR